MIDKTIKATIFSILVFFSISFLTVMLHLNAPWNRIDDYSKMEIGFPLTYYYEFMVDCPIPNSGWVLSNLLIDCLLIWGVVMGGYFFWNKK